MQSPSGIQGDRAAAPSLLHGLQEKAQTGLQATTQIVKEQVALAKQAATDRVQVARSGKKLLDDGGEPAAQAVAAKQLSRDAADMDLSVARRVNVATTKLDISVAQLRMVQSAQDVEGSGDFAKLADEHEVRASTCRRIADMLETPAPSAEMSAAELDAAAIVQARAGCATLMTRTVDGFASVKQNALSSIASGRTTPDAREPSLSSEAPTLLQNLQGNARAGLQKVKQAANDRVETARAGKRLLDDGGQDVAQAILAKKACLDAAEIYQELAQRVKSAIALFDDSANKLKQVQWGPEGDGNPAQLAEMHEARASTYMQIAELLETPIACAAMTPVEWDALSLVKMRKGCDTLQCRTNAGFDSVKDMAFASCAPEGNSEERRRKSVCT